MDLPSAVMTGEMMADDVNCVEAVAPPAATSDGGKVVSLGAPPVGMVPVPEPGKPVVPLWMSPSTDGGVVTGADGARKKTK